MTFEEAVRRSIKSYFKGEEASNFFKTNSKRPKYTKKYFDKIEEDRFGSPSDWDSLSGED